jgi:prolyl oligopeptidase
MNILNLDFAVANIRGGGEYGHAWHEAGMLDKKQNVFDDFQFAAEYLINNNFVDNDKLFIQGGSNGGLLVGACINQRPELYRGAILQVGVLDMLRFHLFTIGHAWQSEYGSPDDETTRKQLLSYSPLHNINGSKTYPSLLCCTSDKDDRVSPLHSYKFMAELQYQVGKNPDQKNPLLLMVDTKAGHGGGKPLKKALEEISKIYTFIANTLGLQL